MGDSIRVVIADDHPLFREGVAHLLNAEPDFDVVGQVSDGEEALALVQEQMPDVILLDIAMPGGGRTCSGQSDRRNLSGDPRRDPDRFRA